jgi:hypothetical protein
MVPFLTAKVLTTFNISETNFLKKGQNSIFSLSFPVSTWTFGHSPLGNINCRIHKSFNNKKKDNRKEYVAREHF